MKNLSESQNPFPENLKVVVLENFPTPIAIAFQRMQTAETWQARTNWALHVFEYSLRSLSLIVVSQYLIKDHDNSFFDPKLDQLLLRQMSRQQFGSWVEILFTTLKYYTNSKRALFIPEMENLRAVRKDFNDLVEKRNKLVHGIHPINEAKWQEEFQNIYIGVITILKSLVFLS